MNGKISSYFKSGAIRVALIVGGCFLLLFAISLFLIASSEEIPGFNGFGVFLLIAGIILLICGGTIGAVSDYEVDSYASQLIGEITETGLMKLGLDKDEVKEIQPITIEGYDYVGSNLYRYGKDMKWRGDRYKAVIFFFSNNEVHCYTCSVSLIDGTRNESTDVYFYNDIVSVSTQTEYSQTVVNGVAKKISYECFKLTTSGGTSINCSIKNSDQVSRSINGMRNLIKSKKSEIKQ